MTGAGSATVAWAAETSYLGGTGSTPTYRLPGQNVEVGTAELNRNLVASLAPGDPEAQEFIDQQLEGQLGLSWVLTNDEFHRLIFNDGFTGFASGLANSAEWYTGVDTLGGTVERQAKGWAPTSAEIVYNGSTEMARVSVTGAYGDEEENTATTPGTISESGTEVPGHAASLSINGTTVARLQSATLAFENISRLRRGPQPRPLDAVAGNVQTSVDMTATFEDPQRYELALGGVGASTTQDRMESVPATLSFDVGGTTVASYDIARLKPDTYSWNDLVNPDADLTESVSFRGAGITGSDPTA